MRNLLIKILKRFPIRNYIVFESVPNLADNTKAVFDELLKRGYNKKYKFVWVVTDKKAVLPRYEHTIYIDKATKFHHFQYLWYTVCAKCLICCNGILFSHRTGQKSFYLTHGTAVKSIRSYYNLPKEIDYVCVASDQVREMLAYELKCDIHKTIGLGQPRNDVFHEPSVDLHDYFSEPFKKLIIWYPTYRQHKKGKQTGSRNALPILYDIKQAEMLNEIAKEYEVLLVVKPHFAQDVSYIKDYKLSNIKFIDDAFYTSHHLTSYECLHASDALITDYSSVYFDYLLCDKPIAVIWEDINEYRENPGFAVDVDYCMKGAEKIYNLEEFKQFIIQVATGYDDLKKDRQEINTWANYSNDGKNTQRVTDFIIEKASL